MSALAYVGRMPLFVEFVYVDTDWRMECQTRPLAEDRCEPSALTWHVDCDRKPLNSAVYGADEP